MLTMAADKDIYKFDFEPYIDGLFSMDVIYVLVVHYSRQEIWL
jgi:hypothetical protein